MFNAKQLLDAMVGSTAIGGKSAKGGFGSGAQGGLGGMLGEVIGAVTQKPQGQSQPGQLPRTGQAGASGGASFSGGFDEAIARITGGRGGNDLFSRAKEFAGTPQGAAVLAGLGGLLLGGKGGRAIAGSAAKLGGVALIGGLAYMAYKNWQAGQPATASGQAQAQLPPPSESAFSVERTSDETAHVLVRAMIAAANADGHVDEAERSRVIGGLKQAGLDPEAAQLLDREFARPATPTELATASTGAEMGAEIYAAARLAIEPDTPQERAFLAQLATSLTLDPGLVAHIDAAAGSAKA